MAYLTDLEILNLRKPGEHPIGPDGGGYGVNIVVSRLKDGTLRYRWIQYIYIRDPKTKKTRRRKISLRATYPELLSADARELGKVNHEMAERGIDPTDVREEDPGEQQPPPTFREMADEVLAEDLKRLENGKLTNYRIKTIRAALNHLLGGIDDNRREGIADKRLDQITRAEILDQMQTHFQERYPTYQTMWGYARKIFMRARKRWPDLTNPVDDTVKSWLGPSDHRVRHHDFVPYHLVAESIDTIRSRTHPLAQSGNLCLQMVILTGCRGKEVRLMEYSQLRSKVIRSPEQWNEDEQLWAPIDWARFDAGELKSETIVWFIPGENTKTREPRRVFMSSGCMELLRDARALQKRYTSSYVFPSPRSPHAQLSDDCLGTKCRSLDLPGTVHGYRTTLRIWWGEVGGDSDAGELQLGHDLGSVKKAYLRTDLLAERAEMMEAWAQYLRGELPDDWEWIPPRAVAKIKAMEEKEERNERRIELLTEAVITLASGGQAGGAALASILSGAIGDLPTTPRSPGPAIDPRLAVQSMMAL